MNETAQDARAAHPESTWAKQRCPFCHGICALVPAVTSARLAPSCEAFKLTTHIHLIKVDSKKWHCPLRHKELFMGLLMIGWKLWTNVLRTSLSLWLSIALFESMPVQPRCIPPLWRNSLWALNMSELRKRIWLSQCCSMSSICVSLFQKSSSKQPYLNCNCRIARTRNNFFFITLEGSRP